MLLTLFKEDSIVSSISKGNETSALCMVKKMYAPNEDHKSILEVLKRDLKSDS